VNFTKNKIGFKKQTSLEDKIILIEKVNKFKSKAKKEFYFNGGISWFYETFGCCSKCFNKKKLVIFEKTMNILDNNLEILHVLKKNLEFDFLKKLILTNKEYYLFPFQFKYINIANLTSTMNYLKILEDISKGKVKPPFENDLKIEQNHIKYEKIFNF